MDFLGDSNNPSALDVVAFVREVTEKFEHLRPAITSRLVAALPTIKSGKVFRGVLWILGEYVESAEGIKDALDAIRGVLGEIPILASEQRAVQQAEDGEELDEKEAPKKEAKSTSRPIILADGTYATETAYSVGPVSNRIEKAAVKPPLRSNNSHISRFFIYVDIFLSALLLGGDFFTGAVLASAMTKLVLRLDELHKNPSTSNELRAEVCQLLVLLASVLITATAGYVDHDIYYPDRPINLCHCSN